MARSAELVAHWHLLVDDFSTSALDFYQNVEEALKERRVPDMRTDRVDWSETGFLSAKREYLRICRGRLTCDICAAPYGTGYFFSSWLSVQAPRASPAVILSTFVGLPFIYYITVSTFGLFVGTLTFAALLAAGLYTIRNSPHSGPAIEDTVLAIPLLGQLYSSIFIPVTYYSVDTRLMFQETVHRALIETICDLRTAQGLRALSHDEARPEMRDLLKA
jgi:hypothetical protein